MVQNVQILTRLAPRLKHLTSALSHLAQFTYISGTNVQILTRLAPCIKHLTSALPHLALLDDAVLSHLFFSRAAAVAAAAAAAAGALTVLLY